MDTHTTCADVSVPRAVVGADGEVVDVVVPPVGPGTGLLTEDLLLHLPQGVARPLVCEGGTGRILESVIQAKCQTYTT